MSMDAYRWALTWDGLTSPEKFVLIIIADHYNEKVHRAWPAIDTLAKQTALGRSTVKRALKRLDDAGLIQIEPWRRDGSKRPLNNRYCLPMYDPRSERAKNLPVVVYAEFTKDGKRTYDTFPHAFQHGEEVPSYAA